MREREREHWLLVQMHTFFEEDLEIEGEWHSEVITPVN